MSIPQEQQEVLTKESELKNESKYLSLFKKLLTKHFQEIQFFQSDNNTEISDTIKQSYNEETEILRKLLSAQRQSYLFGISAGILTFLTVRYLPSTMIRLVGSESRKNKILENQKAIRQMSMWKRMVPFMLEISFASLVGVSSYEKAVEYQSDVFDEMANIPLIKGRSMVSEKICPEWIHLAYYRGDILPVFWDNIKEGKVKEKQKWKNIELFAHNCMKREVYEKKLIAEENRKGIRNESLSTIAIPHPGVPVEVLKDEEISEIIRRIAKNID